jgi:hypothetical protein
MLDKIKKIGIIIIIAILFAVFCFSIVDVVMENPEYNDYCPLDAKPNRPLQKDLTCPSFLEPTESQRESCNSQKGYIIYQYDDQGCPISYECNMCRQKWDEANQKYRLIGFIITTIMGVIAAIIGMYIKSENEIVSWVYSGILIGGIISIFIGTMQYFQDMGRFIKPFVILFEMGLIIWVAVKTSSKKTKGSKKR